MGDVRKISTVANPFVKYLQEDFKDGVFFVIDVSTRINIEQNHFRRMMDRFVDISEEQSIFDFVFKEGVSMTFCTVMADFAVRQQIRQNLDKV